MASPTHFNINMDIITDGWIFKYTHDWDDYQGHLSIKSLPDTSLMRQVFTAKPEILGNVWANQHSAESSLGITS